MFEEYGIIRQLWDAVTCKAKKERRRLELRDYKLLLKGAKIHALQSGLGDDNGISAHLKKFCDEAGPYHEPERRDHLVNKTRRYYDKLKDERFPSKKSRDK